MIHAFSTLSKRSPNTGTVYYTGNAIELTRHYFFSSSNWFVTVTIRIIEDILFITGTALRICPQFFIHGNSFAETAFGGRRLDCSYSIRCSNTRLRHPPPFCEVKRRWARLALRWGITWERPLGFFFYVISVLSQKTKYKQLRMKVGYITFQNCSGQFSIKNRSLRW